MSIKLKLKEHVIPTIRHSLYDSTASSAAAETTFTTATQVLQLINICCPTVKTENIKVKVSRRFGVGVVELSIRYYLPS